MSSTVLRPRFSRPGLGSILAASLFATFLTLPAHADLWPVYIADGVLLADEADGIYAEAFTLPDTLADALRAVPEDGRISMLGLPTAPGERRTVELVRRDVWAPEARLTLVTRKGSTELPKGQRLYFVGEDPSAPEWRMGLILDPESGEIHGFSRGPDGFFEIFRDGHTYQIATSDSLAKAQGVTQSCAQADLLTSSPAGPTRLFGDSVLDRASTVARPAGEKLGGDPTYQAVIALDTDNEFHDKKFDNDTADATAWIESLFVAMNVFYERDLDLNLVIGDTTFRLDTDPSPTYDDDPWIVGGSGASSSQLTEFGTYWSLNMSGVDRVLAALLSGKSASGFSASGIAWLDGYCEYQSTGGGYSINQIFTSSAVAVSNDARLVGHELGHNFGSSHTHCYSPPVDTCYGVESGCYSGPTSCPAEGTGTLMSYCNFSTGCNTSNRSEFHPTVISLLETFRDFHYPGCITDFTGPGEIFDDGFESGNTNSWTDDTIP